MLNPAATRTLTRAISADILEFRARVPPLQNRCRGASQGRQPQDVRQSQEANLRGAKGAVGS
jgi:hypothetical protein